MLPCLFSSSMRSLLLVRNAISRPEKKAVETMARRMIRSSEDINWLRITNRVRIYELHFSYFTIPDNRKNSVHLMYETPSYSFVTHCHFLLQKRKRKRPSYPTGNLLHTGHYPYLCCFYAV